MALLCLMWPPVCVVRFSPATIGTGVNFFLGSFDLLSVTGSFGTLEFHFLSLCESPVVCWVNNLPH